MTYDFTPLFRTAIGFDRLARLADTASAVHTTYPPYNIERTGEDSYRLTMAVAGFGQSDLETVVRESTLVITGRVTAEQPSGEMLHRGIAGRAFERRFTLADHMVVDSAELLNGLLHVNLRREVPEALKPRTITIRQVNATPVIANDTQAQAA